MQTSYTIAQSTRKQLISQGYKNLVIEDRSSWLTYCFLTKKRELPKLISSSRYRLVPLNSDYALEIVAMHIEEKPALIMQLPNIETLINSKQLNTSEYFIKILSNNYLCIYFQGKLLDEIGMHRNKWCDYYLLQEFVEKEVSTKPYFTLGLGYALIAFIYKNFPFNDYDYKEIIQEFEQAEENFRKYCSIAKIKYLSNLSLEEKEEYLSGSVGQEIKMNPWSFSPKAYQSSLANTLYNISQLGFIRTNPFGEIYEPIKIELSI